MFVYHFFYPDLGVYIFFEKEWGAEKGEANFEIGENGF